MACTQARAIGWCLLLVGLLLGGAASRADAPEERLLADVARRFKDAAKGFSGYDRQPEFRIDPSDEVNAYALQEVVTEGGKTVVVPVVRVNHGLLERVIRRQGSEAAAGEADRLAFVVGHELGHLRLGHVKRQPAGKTPFLQHVFYRDEEIAADREGMVLLIDAGFDKARALGVLRRMRELAITRSSFEGIKGTHPTWDDRLATLDDKNAGYWRAMSAFDLGTNFLLAGLYLQAAKCFEFVDRAYPDTPEVESNLGYARLMAYVENLGPVALIDLDVGQIAPGMFYRRAGITIRGPDKELWENAVEALKAATDHDPRLLLARANLGVAYLIGPKDIRRLDLAWKLLQESTDRLATEPAPSALARAAVLNNAAVADLASRRLDQAQEKLDLSEYELAGHLAVRANPPAPGESLGSALSYNQALLQSVAVDVAGRSSAKRLFEVYLKTHDPNSDWWPVAYEQYRHLCASLALKQNPEADLKREAAAHSPSGLLPITSVTVKHDKMVSIGDSREGVEALLGVGSASRVWVSSGESYYRLTDPREGLEFVASDLVLVIRLTDPKGPRLPLRARGREQPVGELAVGMARGQLEQTLRDLSIAPQLLVDPGVNYQYYPNLGVGVLFESDRVKELVVAQLPPAAPRNESKDKLPEPAKSTRTP